MKPVKPVFVERHAYRLRRAQDAARFMGVVGLIAFLLPLAGHMTTKSGAVYIFICWILLILLAGALSFTLRRMASRQQEDEDS